jgi:hypothetical protein
VPGRGCLPLQVWAHCWARALRCGCSGAAEHAACPATLRRLTPARGGAAEHHLFLLLLLLI